MNESDKFKLVRSAIGLSQRELAKEIKTSQAIISAIERGKSPVSRKLLDKLQDKYTLNIDWFLNTRGEMFSKPVPLTQITGNDKDEIIRLLKEQILLLNVIIADKSQIIRNLQDTARMKVDSN